MRRQGGRGHRQCVVTMRRSRQRQMSDPSCGCPVKYDSLSLYILNSRSQGGNRGLEDVPGILGPVLMEPASMVQARKIYVQHRIVEAHGFSSAGNGGFLSHGGSPSYHGCFNTNPQMLETYQLHLRGACCTSKVHGLILTCTIPCAIPCVWALLSLLRFRFQDAFCGIHIFWC